MFFQIVTAFFGRKSLHLRQPPASATTGRAGTGSASAGR
jgi:hypothetical protein